MQSIKEMIEAHTMHLTFCYAGRNGHCSSAGKDSSQVMHLCRNEMKEGVI